MQQYVVEWLTTVFGCLDEHLQVLHHLLLTAEVVERQRAQGVLELLLAGAHLLLPDVKIFVHILRFACEGTKKPAKNQIYLDFSLHICQFFCIFAFGKDCAFDVTSVMILQSEKHADPSLRIYRPNALYIFSGRPPYGERPLVISLLRANGSS